MDARSLNSEVEALLEHATWVQDLAHRLVRDPAQADDIVQETWVAALAERSQPVRSTRAWLAMVVKRLVWQRYRGESRRRAREEDVARAEASPSTSELVERMGAHKQVVGAVMDLPETYRDVILRRYFDGETPTEIAEEQGIPISTVKTRLQRGLARLREQLDGENGGDGKAWAIALAPLLKARAAALRTAAAAAPSVSALSIASWVAVLALLIAAPFAYQQLNRASEPKAVSLVTPDVPESLPSASGPALQPATKAVRESVNDKAASADEIADAALVASRRVLRGRVLSSDGAPVGFVLLNFEPLYPVESLGDVIAISDADGQFEMRGAVGAGVIRSGREDLVTICAAEVGWKEAADELSVIVATRHPVQGVVIDAAGKPLSEARVELLLSSALRARFAGRLEAASPYHPITETEQSGAFTLGDSTTIDGAELLVRREGYVPWRAELEAAAGTLRITLLRPDFAEGTPLIHGRVFDSDGSAFADAHVALLGQATRTQADGFFTLPWDPETAAKATAKDAPLLVAVAPERGAAFQRATLDAQGAWSWPDALELRLSAKPLQLSGRVLNGKGEVATGALVWLSNPSLVTAPAPDNEVGRLTFNLPAGQTISARELPQIAECIAVGQRHRPWTSVKTDTDGNFTLAGLGQRTYLISTLDPATLAIREHGPFEAGQQQLELPLDRNGLIENLRGRVVDPDGVALGGVRVCLSRSAEQISRADEGMLSRTHRTESIRTNLQGEFLLRNVPQEDVHLMLRGPNIIPNSIPLSSLQVDDGPVELVAMPDTRLRVAVSDKEEAIGFDLVDAAGEPLLVLIQRGREWRLTPRVRLHSGRSEVIRVPRTSSKLRLWSKSEVVREIAVQLAAGEVNLIQ
ncbi:MAG: RNA polymerase sigma-70 factor (ECF subfamily) [Planctomycetota bacterium]|jgi:RNA polymerase sigma-70 factor (ECF subfamily)